MARPKKPEDQVRAELKSVRDMLARTRAERDAALKDVATLVMERDRWRQVATEATATLEEADGVQG